MKKLLFACLITFELSAFGQGAQFADKLVTDLAAQEPSFEIGVGYAFKHNEGFGIPRMTLGVNNLLNAGIGFYITPEYRGGITFLEDGTDYYFRIPMGMTFEYGPFGAFLGLDPISALAGKNLRKEIGLSYYDAKVMPVSVRLGYSIWVGPTIGFGYRLPLTPPGSVEL